MEENKKYVRKTFWVHEYEKEEVFLSKMANEGWHFVKLHKGIPTKYEFVKGEKINYIYQLDYVSKEEDTEDYHQLFADAGWNEMFTWDAFGGKWYYFRRIHSDGQNERIFTDSESKYQMYDKLWKKLGLYFLLALFLELNAVHACIGMINEVGLGSAVGIVLLIFCCCFTFLSVVLGYSAIGIIIERDKMKSRLNKKI